MTGEILDAILITIPLWGSFLFVVASDLSDWSDRSDPSDCSPRTPDMKIYLENWRRRRDHGF